MLREASDRAFEKDAFESKYGVDFPDTLRWITSDVWAFGRTDNGPIRELREYGDIWLEQVPEKKVCIQAGGNCGMYAMFYSKFFEKVYTFEPDPSNYACLEVNMQHCPNVSHFRAGLGAKQEERVLTNPSTNNVGTHNIVARDFDPGQADVIVDMTTIDSLYLERCDLIHLDIERHEPSAIAGAMQTIQSFWPIIILETHVDALNDLGYKRTGHVMPGGDSIFLPPQG